MERGEKMRCALSERGEDIEREMPLIGSLFDKVQGGWIFERLKFGNLKGEELA